MLSAVTDTLDTRARTILRQLFDAAIASADPSRTLAAHLPDRPKGRCVVVGAGKAAASMAAAVEVAWPGVPLSGVVVAPYDYGCATKQIAVREAGHPIPDANSQSAAVEMLDAVRGLGPNDLVLALFSGGGSSTMALPLPGVSMAHKQITNRLLLRSGLDIRTMNAIRRRISAVKGGRLAAAAAPARIFTLAISDIPGDDMSAIASGPTFLDPTPDLDLAAAARRLGAELPAVITALLVCPDPIRNLGNIDGARLIACPADALAAASVIARKAGIKPIILGDAIEGESRLVARQMAGLALETYDEPVVLLSGGETTVTLAGAAYGRGGRNTEFLLSLAIALESAPVWALAADTDGIDGAGGGAAGALISPDTVLRSRIKGLDPVASLAAHDSGTFFAELNDLIITGPTRTNVNDFRAILILPQRSLP